MLALLFFIFYFCLLFLANSILDFAFWLVVGLVLWFALDTAVSNRAVHRAQEEKHMEMESLNGPEGKGRMGRGPWQR